MDDFEHQLCGSFIYERGYESMIIFSNTGYGSRIVYLGIQDTDQGLYI